MSESGFFHSPLVLKLTNKQNRNKLIGTKNKLMIAKRDGGVELEEKSEGIKKYKLAVTK